MSDKPFTFSNFLKNILMMAGIGVVFLLFFFYIYLPASTNHSETITVPELVGMPFSDIEEFVTQRDLRYEIVADSGYSDSFDPMTILSQNPKPGSKVKMDRKIYITLNAQVPPEIKMPNLINTNVENAEDILKSNGLKMGEITYEPNPANNAVLAQMIKGQKIEPNTYVFKGSIVDVVIGDGEGVQRFPAPNFLGKSLDEVKFQINASNLKLDVINFIRVDSLAENSVYKQLPPAGIMIRSGDLIEIWVNGQEDIEPQDGTGQGDSDQGIKMK
ncbi:MAG: beta-lactam-binding protein with PASTA domain [Roseivirga sp.]|jgi:beta-lactam-binding protein with PASTA domain